MAQRAPRRKHTSDNANSENSGAGNVIFDWPITFPASRQRSNRRVGTIRAWHPRKNFGLLVDENGTGDATFTMDDVAPCDRTRLGVGNTVTYLAVIDRDGVSARQVRADSTTLPPPPSDAFILKGWR